MAIRRGYSAPLVDRTMLVDQHGAQRPSRIILHSTESSDAAGIGDATAIASWFQTQGRGYGTQLCIDGHGHTVRMVWDTQVGWGTGGSNTGSLQIEMVGRSTFTAKDWDARGKQLKQVAKWVAYWSRTYGIPISSGVTRGVATHAMHSAAFHLSDHTDPGSAFPFARVLRYARWYRVAGWGREPGY
jgi:hypothetical protein